MLPVIRRIADFDRERRAAWKAGAGGVPPGELTPQEAAMLLGLSPASVYVLIKEGKVEHLNYDMTSGRPTVPRITVRGLIHYALTRCRGADENELGGSIERLLIAINSDVLRRIAARIEIILAKRENRQPPAAALQAYGAAPASTTPPIEMVRVTEVQQTLFP